MDSHMQDSLVGCWATFGGDNREALLATVELFTSSPGRRAANSPDRFTPCRSMQGDQPNTDSVHLQSAVPYWPSPQLAGGQSPVPRCSYR